MRFSIERDALPLRTVGECIMHKKVSGEPTASTGFELVLRNLGSAFPSSLSYTFCHRDNNLIALTYHIGSRNNSGLFFSGFLLCGRRFLMKGPYCEVQTHVGSLLAKSRLVLKCHLCTISKPNRPKIAWAHELFLSCVHSVGFNFRVCLLSRATDTCTYVRTFSAWIDSAKDHTNRY